MILRCGMLSRLSSAATSSSTPSRGGRRRMSISSRRSASLQRRPANNRSEGYRDFEPSLSVGGQQVTKPEGIRTDLLADGKLYRIAEGRPIKNKGVKLSVLAARVDLRRKLREKLLVDPPPEKRRVKPGWVDAHDYSLEPQADELSDQSGRIAFPHRG